MNTGMSYRVERNGKTISLDLQEMTDDEVKAALIDHDKDELIRIICRLSKWC